MMSWMYYVVMDVSWCHGCIMMLVRSEHACYIDLWCSSCTMMLWMYHDAQVVSWCHGCIMLSWIYHDVMMLVRSGHASYIDWWCSSCTMMLWMYHVVWYLGWSMLCKWCSVLSIMHCVAMLYFFKFHLAKYSKPQGIVSPCSVGQFNVIQRNIFWLLYFQLCHAPVSNDVQLVTRRCLHGYEVSVQFSNLSSDGQHLPPTASTKVSNKIFWYLKIIIWNLISNSLSLWNLFIVHLIIPHSLLLLTCNLK